MTKRSINFKCVFWNEELRSWSDYGCSYSTDSPNETVAVRPHYCSCNHTTNFALLMVSDTQ